MSEVNLYNSFEFINTAERTAFITYSMMSCSPIKPVGAALAQQLGMDRSGVNKTLAIVSNFCPPPSSLAPKLTAREKTAYITYTVMSGSPVTASAMALVLNTTVRTIERTMEKISYSLPIIKDGSQWVRMIN